MLRRLPSARIAYAAAAAPSPKPIPSTATNHVHPLPSSAPPSVIAVNDGFDVIRLGVDTDLQRIISRHVSCSLNY